MGKLFAALAFLAVFPSAWECAAIGQGSAIGGGAVGGGAIGNGSVGGMTSGGVDCGSPPTTNLVYLLDGDNVNGSANAGLTHGDAVMTWENQASGGSANDAVAPSNTARPVFISGAINGHDALSFDGQGDQVSLQNSTTVANAFTASRTGDVVLVVRIDSAPISAYNYFFASTTGTATAGPMIGINANRTSFNYMIGGSTTYNGVDPGVSYTLGAWTGYEFRMDNTNLKYKLDSQTEGSTALTFTTAANLGAAISLGCNPGGTTQCTNMAVAFAAVYTNQMDTTDRAAMKEFVSCRYGIDLY